MKMNPKSLKYLMIIISLMLLINCLPNATDFTYYFEDNKITNDLIRTTSNPWYNEEYYESYYWGPTNPGTPIADPRNGILAQPFNNVE